MKCLKKNDKVVVISGKDKGKQGLVLEICHKTDRVRVEGVCIVTRHVKPRGQGQKGGIIKEEGYIHISNVMPIDPSTNEPCRVNKLTR
jgi:large subunit ribosomal protein L24